MGALYFNEWSKIEKYMHRGLTIEVYATISFKSIPEQLIWYLDLLDIFNPIRKAQQSLSLKGYGKNI